MTGDYTRDTFRPWRRFSAVRQQQGRVHVDADWNEQVDIDLHLERTTALDVIGQTGMPEASPGFLITPVPASPGADLLIGAGRAYVQGVLVEHDSQPVALTKVSGTGANTTWEVSGGPRLVLGQFVGIAPDPAATFAKVSVIEAPQQGDNGRQRVRFDVTLGGGNAKEVVAYASALVQPFLPGAVLPQANGFYLAYLEVWEREVTHLEDEYIADVALGGPDTATRSQVIWQVKFLPLAPLIADGSLGNPPMCKSFPPGWMPGSGNRLRLKVRADATQAQANPCELPAKGGYRSLENHLYRIEIHKGGVQGTGSILVKWSRDNAIHRTRLLDVADGSLVVEEVGKDDVTALATDDWVEVRDEGRILHGEPGFFVEIGEVVGTRLGIRTILHPETLAPLTQNGEPDVQVLPKTGLVRRWEGGKPTELVAGQDFVLENGVVVTSLPGVDVAVGGDYWLVPARSLTAAVEWPTDPATLGPAAMPPQGVARRYSPLAIIEKVAAGWSVKDDCRNIFSPLTKIESFFYLGGDGQEAMPDPTASGNAAYTLLESPLRVGVARGRTPVKGKPVRFRVADQGANSGRLSLVAGTPPADVLKNTQTEIVLRTNAGGVAQVGFSIHKDRHHNHVVAELLDASDPAQADVLHLSIVFSGTTSVAAEVAYDPKNCLYQAAPAITPGISKTVQAAIDKLCPRIEFMPFAGDGQTLCAGKPGPWPLVAGVFWGKESLAGIEVDFKVVAGDATVSPPKAVTNASGIATAQIIAGTDVLANSGVVLVEATLASPPATPAPPKLTFGARFLNAECIYLGPKVCPPGQKEADSNALADIINHLCKAVQSGKDDEAIRVTGIYQWDGSTGSWTLPLKAQSTVDPGLLEPGFFIALDGELDPSCLEGGPVGDVIIDLPFPVVGSDVYFWWLDRDDPRPFARESVKLFGKFVLGAIEQEEGEAREQVQGLFWQPDKDVVSWLGKVREVFKNRLQSRVEIPTELILYGNRIYSKPQQRNDKSRLYLDGDLFLDSSYSGGARYPSGDGRRGGNLHLPFTIGD
ncbi:DUF6519 domain-containing protein [Rhizobium terrae]|uniref:DUF6519 domain-containing protein n=1 Tax=Rhizobium terrae TaxID=2171756 RepID=UPI000E3C1DAC|nr:DUF6519 domain-containing protein [Rhizobium terrae]